MSNKSSSAKSSSSSNKSTSTAAPGTGDQAPGGRKAPRALPPTGKLAVVAAYAQCPKRMGTSSGTRAMGTDGKGGYWPVYVSGGTVEQAIKAGATTADLRWDLDHGFVTLA